MTRECSQCDCDISDRANNAVFCADCSMERNRKRSRGGKGKKSKLVTCEADGCNETFLCLNIKKRFCGNIDKKIGHAYEYHLARSLARWNRIKEEQIASSAAPKKKKRIAIVDYRNETITYK